MIGASVACGGWVYATAAEPDGVDAPVSQLEPACPRADASRPVSRIIGVRAVDQRAIPERFQRSELDDPLRTAAVGGDDGDRSPVITAQAVRELPGDGTLPAWGTIAPVPPASSPPALPRFRAGGEIPVADASETDVFNIMLGAGLAVIAVLIGLWLRRRQVRQTAAVQDERISHCQPATIPFEHSTAPLRSRLEALIRNELSLIEESVQFPDHLEFYGWPAGLPITRIDAGHLGAEAGSERSALSGPHFLRRSRAGTAAGGAAPGASSQPSERRLRRDSSRPGKITVLHAAHSSEKRPRPSRPEADDPSAVPGPLERALERLAKKQL